MLNNALTALHTAATGMQALSTKIDVIANNIANADTPGFKAARGELPGPLVPALLAAGCADQRRQYLPAGNAGRARRGAEQYADDLQAGLGILTGEPLDVMIQGDGFFQVELPGGATGYTRAGNFVRNANGELVLGNSFGYRLKDTPPFLTMCQRQDRNLQ